MAVLPMLVDIQIVDTIVRIPSNEALPLGVASPTAHPNSIGKSTKFKITYKGIRVCASRCHSFKNSRCKRVQVFFKRGLCVTLTIGSAFHLFRVENSNDDGSSNLTPKPVISLISPCFLFVLFSFWPSLICESYASQNCNPCVTKIAVAPREQMRRITRSNSSSFFGSRPLAGSSITRIACFRTKALAIARRRFMPPLNSLTNLWECSAKSTNSRARSTSLSVKCSSRNLPQNHNCCFTDRSECNTFSCGTKATLSVKKVPSLLETQPLESPSYRRTSPRHAIFPTIAFARVDFPAPDSPVIATSLPGSI